MKIDLENNISLPASRIPGVHGKTAGRAASRVNKEDEINIGQAQTRNIQSDDNRLFVSASSDPKSRLKDEGLVSQLVARSLPLRRVDMVVVRRRVMDSAMAEGEEAQRAMREEANAKKRGGGANASSDGKQNVESTEEQSRDPETLRRKAAKRDLELYNRFQNLPEQSHSNVRIELRHNKAFLSVCASGSTAIRCYKSSLSVAVEAKKNPRTAANEIDSHENSSISPSATSGILSPPVAAACFLKVRSSLTRPYSTALPSLPRTCTREALPLTVFWDPFCGDGTLILEALGLLQAVPPGNPNLNYPMLHFPCHDAERYEDFQADLCEQITQQIEKNAAIDASASLFGGREIALIGTRAKGARSATSGATSTSPVETALQNFDTYLRRLPRAAEEEDEGTNPFLGATYLGSTKRLMQKSGLANLLEARKEQEIKTENEKEVDLHSKYLDDLKLDPSDYMIDSDTRGGTRHISAGVISELREAVRPVHSVCFRKNEFSVEGAERIYRDFDMMLRPSRSHHAASAPAPERPAPRRGDVNIVLFTNLPYGPGIADWEVRKAHTALSQILKRCPFVTDAFCVTGRKDLQKDHSWRVQMRSQNGNGVPIELLRWQRDQMQLHN
ncbi:unnamed protein product [Amoebophrya sp. A25]|nr:unnamed protein product [Amoebophrya sp. A25]|eukprot:GSA25T00014203001.1